LEIECDDLARLIRQKGTRNGNRIAVRLPDGDLSYRELDEESERIAGGLAHHGVTDGERLAVLLPNIRAFVLTWIGAAKAGAVFVPLNTALKRDLLEYELNDCAPRGIVVDAERWNEYASTRNPSNTRREWLYSPAGSATSPEAGVLSWEELREHGVPRSEITIHPWTPASILYTSGTTGPPKGAVLPHRRLISTPSEIARRARLDETSVLFTTLPLFHCNAQEKTTLAAVVSDATAVVEDRFHASRFWETAGARCATHVSLLTTMVNILFKQPDRASDRTHGVRMALTSGTHQALWPKFEERFALRVLETYGMTECGCTTLMNPPDAIRVGSVGTPLGFVEADVVDDVDRSVGPGVRGELVVRPRRPFTMFLGYYGKPEATVESWRNLWFHTGDYVTVDADGYYYFVDRKKDVIRRRGENVAPYDVERVVNGHESVLESVVVGVPSEVGEEEVKAFVVVKSGREVGEEAARELFGYLGAELPFFMVPRYVEYVDEIPKTANEKAQRYRLKQARTLGGREYDREALGVKGNHRTTAETLSSEPKDVPGTR